MRRFGILILLLVILGCSSEFEKAVLSAEEAMNDGDFESALSFYRLALEEEDDDVVEGIVYVLEQYERLVKLVEKKEWLEADVLLDETDFSSAPEPLAEVVDVLRKEVDGELEKIVELEKLIDEVNELIESRELDRAQETLDMVKDDEHYAFVQGLYEGSVDKFEQMEAEIEEERRIEEEKRRKEEERKRKEEEERRKLEKQIKDKREYFLTRMVEVEKEEKQALEKVSGSTIEYNELYYNSLVLWEELLDELYDFITGNISNTEGLQPEQEKWHAKVKDNAEEMSNVGKYGTAATSEGFLYQISEIQDRMEKLMDKYLD